jgi:hypothetical protein
MISLFISLSCKNRMRKKPMMWITQTTPCPETRLQSDTPWVETEFPDSHAKQHIWRVLGLEPVRI